MANKNKPGIKYFSQDSNHVQNKKVKLLFNEFDSHGPWVWECLKCEIYEKKGYYFDINDPDELMLFASDVCKKQVSLVKEIINGCVRRGLLDETVFNTFKVLTSDRIQFNYLDGTREPRKKGYGIDLIEEYLVINIPPNEKSINIISLKNEFSREKQENSREKPHKLDKSREEESKSEECYTRDEGFELSVLKFFGFNQNANPDKVSLVSECCRALVNSAHYDYFKTQFGFYSAFIPLIGTRYKHSFYKFLGKQENCFLDGVWNAENWEQKLADEKGKKQAVKFPDRWDFKYAGSLNSDELQGYFKHLESLGWSKTGQKNGYPVWEKVR